MQKICRLAAVSSRLSTTALQIVRHEGCLKKSSLQKFGASRLSKTWPKTRWCPRSNFQQVHNRQTKIILFLKWHCSAKSMQTLQHACSVAFFQLLTRTFITFEHKNIFLWNLVILCQNISSTSHKNTKYIYWCLAELWRFC